MHQKRCKSNICDYWYFLDKNFKYEQYHSKYELWIKQIQKAMNFNNAAIVSVKGSDYRIHFWYMSKNDAINIMKNSNVNEKNGSL